MTAQPKHPGQHMTGQQRRAHQLRKEAAAILEDKYDMLHQVTRRVNQLGGPDNAAAWTDHLVEIGLEIICQFEKQIDKLITDAEYYDSLMQDIGA